MNEHVTREDPTQPQSERSGGDAREISHIPPRRQFSTIVFSCLLHTFTVYAPSLAKVLATQLCRLSGCGAGPTPCPHPPPRPPPLDPLCRAIVSPIGKSIVGTIYRLAASAPKSRQIPTGLGIIDFSDWLRPYVWVKYKDAVTTTGEQAPCCSPTRLLAILGS